MDGFCYCRVANHNKCTITTSEKHFIEFMDTNVTSIVGVLPTRWMWILVYLLTRITQLSVLFVSLV